MIPHIKPMSKEVKISNPIESDSFAGIAPETKPRIKEYLHVFFIKSVKTG